MSENATHELSVASYAAFSPRSANPFCCFCANLRIRIRQICCRAPQGARGLKSAWAVGKAYVVRSRPARGAWIEINLSVSSPSSDRSRPARGAWIEMDMRPMVDDSSPSRAPQGARGLKWVKSATETISDSRAPQGARGLKSTDACTRLCAQSSRPARGAWIEIPFTLCQADALRVAPRKGRVD